MAEATTAQAQATMVQACETYYDFLVTDGANVLTNIANEGYNGDNLKGDGATRGAIRDSIKSVEEKIKARLKFTLEELAASADVDIPFSFGDEFFRRLRRYYDDVEEYAGGSVDSKVAARGWTRGGEPTLTGVKVFRLNVDDHGQTIETGNPQDNVIQVISGPGQSTRKVAFSSSAPGLDKWDLQGRGAYKEVSLIDDNNISATVDGLTQAVVDPLLAHGVDNGSAVTDADLANWTLSGDTHFTSDTSITYRDAASSLSTTGVNADGAYVYQDVSTELDKRIAWLPVVAVYTDGINAADGFVIDWGGKSQAFTGLTDQTWEYLVPDRDVDLYPTQFDSATIGNRIKVTVDDDNATGTYKIGAIFWIPMFRFNSTPWACVTDVTNPTTGTAVTVTDSLAVAGVINHSIATAFGNETNEAYLPTSGTNTISDP